MDAPFLTDVAIDVAALEAAVVRDGDGALAVFVGRVRDHHEGRAVAALEYHAYPEMAEKELARVAAEIAERWPQARVLIRHRVGRLAIGDVAVAVVAATPHRDEAFAACRHGIERIKETVPIWKKEFGPDGESWVEGCAARPHAS